MKISILQAAMFVIGGGGIGCIAQQVLGLGNGSAGTGIGCTVGLIAAGIYAFTQRNEPV